LISAARGVCVLEPVQHRNLDVPSNLNITSNAFGRITDRQLVDQAGPRTIQMSLRHLF